MLKLESEQIAYEREFEPKTRVVRKISKKKREMEIRSEIFERDLEID
jgi:hypothetical protein